MIEVGVRRVRQSFARFADVGEHQQCLQNDFLFFVVGKVLVAAERAIFLFENRNVLAVTRFDETGEIEFGGGRQFVAVVRERRGKVEQESVAAQDAVNVLPLGIVLVALVRFVEQNVPATVVIVIAKINDALFLLVAQIVGAVVKDGDFLMTEQGWKFALDLGVLFQFAQANEQRAACRVVLVDVIAQLLDQVFAVRQHQQIVRRNFAALHQRPQHLDQFDDDERLARSRRHPESHPIDQVFVCNLSIGDGIVRREHRGVVAFLAERNIIERNLVIGVPLEERALAFGDLRSFGNFGSLGGVKFPQRFDRVLQRGLLIVPQIFRFGKARQIHCRPRGRQGFKREIVEQGLEFTHNVSVGARPYVVAPSRPPSNEFDVSQDRNPINRISTLNRLEPIST